MDFRYSEELSEADNPTSGLAGSIPVRQHRDAFRGDIGALRAQRDWNKHVGVMKVFKGGLSHKYGLVPVAIPECRPERLELVSYASEIGFLYDDYTEFLSREGLNHANDIVQAAFTESFQNSSNDAKFSNVGLRTLQANLLRDMIAIDKPRALTAMKLWLEFLSEAGSSQCDMTYHTYDQYMQHRILDVGEMFWLGLVTYGMALTIPESEMQQVRRITRPAWLVLALQNDLCSYDKEYDAAVIRSENGSSLPMLNVLCVLMSEHQLDLEDARTLCRQHIEFHVEEYQTIIATHRDDTSLSRDTRIYVESLLYTISGDAAWSLITPRYNADQTYNELQLKMMKDGLDDVLRTTQNQECSASMDVISEKFEADGKYHTATSQPLA